MQHFRTRNDLLEWLEERAPYRQIRRAIVEGRVELYGYFEDSAFMPGGWVVYVRSRFGHEWFVCTYLNPHTHTYHTMVLHTVLWSYWRGGNSELFQGDHPEKYAELRDKYNLEV